MSLTFMDAFPWYMNEDRTFMLYKQDTLKLLPTVPDSSVDLIFADPPYFLSNGGYTCKNGKRSSVHKGDWDKSMGIIENHEYNLTWLKECQRILSPTGTMFVSGTHHVIYSIGFAMQQLDMKILNDISWFKVNPPPNLACRYFTHACESIIWAAPSQKSRHYFDYHSMKAENGGKQMKSLWSITPPKKIEKRFGKHPTQKPLTLLNRIVKAASKPGDLVLDPFCGSGTTGIAAALQDRRFIGIDMSDEYLTVAKNRFEDREVEMEMVRQATFKTLAEKPVVAKKAKKVAKIEEPVAGKTKIRKSRKLKAAKVVKSKPKKTK
jgi:site-specific DNA-methyltransferase (adenine-specific)